MNSFFLNPRIYQLSKSLEEQNLTYKNTNSRVLVACRAEDFTEVNENFLAKVLEAIHLKLEELNLILLSPEKGDISINQFVKNNDIQEVICFGINTKKIGLMPLLKKYRTFHFNGFKILLADTLKEIQLNKEKKILLWQQLKNDFQHDPSE